MESKVMADYFKRRLLTKLLSPQPQGRKQWGRGVFTLVLHTYNQHRGRRDTSERRRGQSLSSSHSIGDPQSTAHEQSTSARPCNKGPEPCSLKCRNTVNCTAPSPIGTPLTSVKRTGDRLLSALWSLLRPLTLLLAHVYTTGLKEVQTAGALRGCVGRNWGNRHLLSTM